MRGATGDPTASIARPRRHRRDGGPGTDGAFALPAIADIVDEPISHSASGARLELAPIGTYETGVFDEGASEIVSYDAGSQWSAAAAPDVAAPPTRGTPPAALADLAFGETWRMWARLTLGAPVSRCLWGCGQR
ncbi:hypothetical protein [Jiangella rhizosphaerae]|nr:hypothetical protein [Jiangella rhizosphaerae]